MAPPQRSTTTARHAGTRSTKPERVEVKLPVLHLRGPGSADIIRPNNPQNNMPANSGGPGSRPQATPAAGPRSSPKDPPRPTPSLMIESCVPRRTGSFAQHPIGPSAWRHPGEVSSSRLKECLIIRSLHRPIQMTADPDCPAAQVMHLKKPKLS